MDFEHELDWLAVHYFHKTAPVQIFTRVFHIEMKLKKTSKKFVAIKLTPMQKIKLSQFFCLVNVPSVRSGELSTTSSNFYSIF